MAIETVIGKRALKLELDGGTVDGKQKVVNKTYNNIKVDAMDENIHTCGALLSTLQSKSLLQVKKVEEKIIREV